MPGARITSGERVTLRTVEREDVPFLQRGSANPGIRYPLGTPLRTQSEIEESLEDDDDDRFLVCIDGGAERAPDAPRDQPPRADDAAPGGPDEQGVRPIGTVSVEDADWKRPELGYWLVPAVRGEGYGSEAVSLVLDYVFRTYDTPAVGAGAFAFNDASRGLLESLGFSEEGRRRQFMFVDGEHRDRVEYGLLREEWRARDEG